MSIRLNKALRELNIGLQTAVEFLEKKSELGEVKSDLSFKLNDQQYQALVEAFKQDAAVRTEAEKLFQKKPKEKKRTAETKETRAEDLLKATPKQVYTPKGKIDLDSVGKKPAAKKAVAPEEKEEEKVEVAAVKSEPKKEEVAPKVEEKPIEKVTEAPVKEENVEEKSAEKPTEKAVETPVEETKKEDNAAETELYTLKSEQNIQNAPGVKVLGKMDLDALNQNTRPKKKSKEEKRKEREDKTAQQGGERKKRVRINKERVDINAEAKQNNNASQGKNGNNNNAGRNKNKKNRNKRNQKPLEVDDEAVARQVKETLARLTNKTQNKKGAKYRKEKREAVQEKLQQEAKAEKRESKVLKLTEFVTVSELATMMDITVTQVISTLMSVGIMVSINQRLDAETINMVADEFGFKTEYVSAEVQEAVSEEEDDENDLVSRAPIYSTTYATPM